MHDDMGWALVAGGSGGIGGAVCRALAADGWDVALTYHRNKQAAERVAADIEQIGRRTEVVALDLTDEVAAAAVVQNVTGADPLSGVVYAAGPQVLMSYISAISPADFRNQVHQDALACYNLLQPSLPQLRQTGGAIVAVSTPAVRRYLKRDFLSAGPKAAIEAMVRAIASEEGRHGVRANAIGVGLVEGPGMWGALRERGDYSAEFLTASRKTIPLPRFGSIDDIGEAVRFLISPRAGWITGQVLNVDGGYSI